ncbi:stalk domain-containing protein [Brevibacillus sp. SYSU BS000544]|uniref:stalk domain-containing protein n=1 Tax=Brevibacillus sp. SYSU BS000544 TaxID=3416443 RepID=UPI003CE4C9FA
MTKKLLFSTILSMSLAGSLTVAAAGMQFVLKVNDEIKDSKNIQVINGKTYLPLREVSTLLGANVTYDTPTRTISIQTGAGSHEHTAHSLDVLAAQNGDDISFTLNTDIKFSADHYGKEHVAGEGHAHIYLDGQKVAGLKESVYLLKDVPVGPHKIDVTLQQNDHKDMGVKKSFDITVLPTLDAQLVVDDKKAIISFSTNLKISAENYGKAHVTGEGHAHVYLDGQKVTGLKTNDPYTLDKLIPGKHTIKIDLQQNDHQSYGVEKVFEIEVK